ncbi:DNA-directed RNA polymerase subunit omega [Oceanicola sp. 22II-s10i]|uniref:DUF2062 domain-containing protein n=1 Tax=Oceanicola sp. 22II-s10i TaxID=1317116 RepID=UPI000B52410F|nr:DUF2062 domain-containing protein [Oceanicola sp. 22II-s10i]OWU86324.1 DNA-directed RNA polymerase subunit omega [Oceanicola sp. 22II-s10i]
MVFKRRDRRPIWQIVAEFLWPRTGWARAFHYVKHRVRRLPDSPDRIARGIFAGVFTVFTPFYGLHFVTAALIAKIMRGNIIAALLATFVGNPLTYLPIAVISLQTGHFLLGRPPRPDGEVHRTIGGKFADAFADLKDNVIAAFTDHDMDWHGLTVFYHDIFYPYMIGGILPGLIAGIVAYYLSLPVIRAYQHRRKGALQERIKRIKAAKAAKAESKSSS